MTHKHFFEWNIPADNQFSGSTDRYIDVIATWDSEQYYNDGRPMVFIHPSYDFDFHDAMSVKDWFVARGQIEDVARNYFADIAKRERLKKAKAILIDAGGETGCPTLDLYAANLTTKETLS